VKTAVRLEHRGEGKFELDDVEKVSLLSMTRAENQ
jgi:hypothetical protein